MEYRSNFHNDITRFGVQDNQVWLAYLAGLVCGLGGRDEGPQRARGLVSLRTSEGSSDLDPMRLVESELKDNSVRLVLQNPKDTLRIESCWEFNRQHGIWSRRDTLTNIGGKAIQVFRCLAQFVFTPGVYEYYHQASNWCLENQGGWHGMGHGTIVFNSEGGRTCQNGTPYLALQESGGSAVAAFHIIPRGNWRFELAPETLTPGNISYPFTIVRAGLSDEYMNLTLNPGQSFELPEILIQAVPDGKVESGAAHLHRYWLDRPSSHKKTMPVIYNTWFDDFEFLDPTRLRRQLAAAKKIGCEMFVVDAGWYGRNENSWFFQCGDWREKTHTAFRGAMREFADEVRAAGLGFGIWMEAEIVGKGVPLEQEHPDWLIPTASNCLYYNLENPVVYDFLLSEISRVLTEYETAFMKVDFNREIGVDPTGAELAGYYAAWYRMLDELHQRHPGVFFEACASGGMRSDLNTLAHFDCHFLSDTAEPTTMLRIAEGAMLRLPPGRISKWVVLRDAGKDVPRYGTPLAQAPNTILAPAGATWDPVVNVDVDYACRIALPGMLGFSGDPAGLNAKTLERLGFHVDFYKKWRSFLADCAAHPLAPIRPISDRTGWAAFECENPTSADKLLLVYRLDDQLNNKTFYPVNLISDRIYRVVNIDAPPDKVQQLRGEEIMRQGIEVSLAKKYTAAIIEIVAV
jgi:alpha-galactosidase